MIGCDYGSRVSVVLDDLLIASGVRMYVHHVTDTTGGQPVQAGTDTLDGDDVQVSCAGVVCTVHDGTAAVLSVPNLCPLLVPRLMLISLDRESISEGRKKTYTGRPRVILSLPPGAPRLREGLRQ